MVQSLLWDRLFVLPLLRTALVGVLPCSAERHVSGGSRHHGARPSCHGPLVFGFVRVAVLRETASVGMGLWPRAYLYGYDECLLLASVRATADPLD